MSKEAMFALLDEGEEILGRISDAFGPEDFKTRRATAVFQDLLVDPTEETVKLAVMYLRWCINYPTRIGQEPEKPEGSSCGDCKNQTMCENGFILDDPELMTWRPCHKKLPEVHDHWQKETGYLYERR